MPSAEPQRDLSSKTWDIPCPIPSTAALAVVCSAVYAVNRLLALWQPSGRAPFLRDYLNDLLFVPAFYPLFLALLTRLRIRPRGYRLSALAMLGHGLTLSLLFEVVFPSLWHRGTADWKDTLCYAAGLLIFGIAQHLEPRLCNWA